MTSMFAYIQLGQSKKMHPKLAIESVTFDQSTSIMSWSDIINIQNFKCVLIKFHDPKTSTKEIASWS